MQTGYKQAPLIFGGSTGSLQTNIASIFDAYSEQTMTPEKTGQPVRIIITNETPVEYWCNLLSCEKQDLLHALSVISDSYIIVDYYLTLNRKKK